LGIALTFPTAIELDLDLLVHVLCQVQDVFFLGPLLLALLAIAARAALVLVISAASAASSATAALVAASSTAAATASEVRTFRHVSERKEARVFGGEGRRGRAAGKRKGQSKTKPLGEFWGVSND
jgi:membrane protein implicated in regulation of membrane protease activity